MKQLFILAAFPISATFSFAQNKSDKKASVKLIRNATLVLNYAGKNILVDPMFAAKGTIGSVNGEIKNPTVELKMPINDITAGLDLLLVTHSHPDHFDSIADSVLDKSIKLFNQPADTDFFKKANFTNAVALTGETNWNNISITRLEAQHGTGEVLKLMGKTSGFILKADKHPTVYIVGDAVWTDEIKKNIETFQPDYIIVNSGGAIWPGYENTPIIMDEEQTVALVKASGKAKIIAVHMDALDHCRTTRTSLRKKADEANISSTKLLIPADGEMIELKMQIGMGI